mmetsp:Transcript_4184/g.13062  ORF Transcript_4184/g.13062 Transcript_4184/m.13062 type:complete len:205 (-) Transcript_4184:198-812(-)
MRRVQVRRAQRPFGFPSCEARFRRRGLPGARRPRRPGLFRQPRTSRRPDAARGRRGPAPLRKHPRPRRSVPRRRAGSGLPDAPHRGDADGRRPRALFTHFVDGRLGQEPIVCQDAGGRSGRARGAAAGDGGRAPRRRRPRRDGGEGVRRRGQRNARHDRDEQTRPTRPLPKAPEIPRRKVRRLPRVAASSDRGQSTHGKRRVIT